MNGITYYRLKSEYTGDYTKNCALNGSEVDNNFYVLEGRDVKSISSNGNDLVLTLMNGDTVVGTGMLDFAKTEDVQHSVVNVEFDKLNGVLKLTNVDGSVQNIEGFATNENTKFSVATDSTLFGSGLMNSPLSVSPLVRTGQFRPVKAIVDMTEGCCLPHCDVLPGDRYLTCEDISDFGYLYDYNAVREIACRLKKTGWHIPSKEEWDDLLNSVEPCDCDKTHEKCDTNCHLGKWAGKLLKSKNFWRECSCGECCDNCGCDCDCHKPKCPCGDECECGQDICFDYSDDPCVNTKECDHTTKCECDKCKEHKGLDAFGFRATPAGYADDDCRCRSFKERALFWSATTNKGLTKAYAKGFKWNRDDVYQDLVNGNYHLSLRLVKDYDGRNYHDVEEIMDMEYPTLLLPSEKKGKSIWTACNVACSENSLHPMLPNEGQGISYTRHYFINEWNGRRWVRNEIKEGESVVVAKAPKSKTMVEYRLIDNKLVSVNEMIYEDVMADVEVVIEGVTEQIVERIDNETERAKQVESDIWDAIAKEAAAREDVDNQQWVAIENESTLREQEDKKIYDALAQETTDRISVDNQQLEVINSEVKTREEEDQKLYEALAQETTDRISVDNQQWDAINGEIKTREEEDQKLYEALAQETSDRISVDNQQWDAINTEREERKQKDEEIEGKLLIQEGTEFDSETGVLTLKSSSGTNDVSVQFTFNFGEF